ncbi:LuxR C-terminal-related transcriptional regulator [Actinosynnema sp. NPDC050436]|uniref:helix-turn-helix domain-containing protein n=1 Tax=Actinosynnema sp. NPDC050436 TaxID=3155659 RepID=UPI0033FEC1E2
MTSTGSDAVAIPSARGLPPSPEQEREPADPALDMVKYALQCVRQALASVEQAALTLAEERGGSRMQPETPPVVTARYGGGDYEPWLTKQERRVLTLVAAGLSNRDIANALQISEKTAKNYVHTVLVKLDADSRTEAAFTALYEKLVDPDECHRASKRQQPATWLVPPPRSRPLS